MSGGLYETDAGANDGACEGDHPELGAIWHATPDGVPAEPGEEGFVHASFRSQLAETLALHYGHCVGVVLLRLDPDALGTRLVLEASRGGQLFPHIYGTITATDIAESLPAQRGGDGAFDLGAIPA